MSPGAIAKSRNRSVSQSGLTDTRYDGYPSGCKDLFHPADHLSVQLVYLFQSSWQFAVVIVSAKTSGYQGQS